MISKKKLHSELERLYGLLNRPEYIDPDPLLFLHSYDDIRDREIAGLVASSLAYGKVASIMKSAGNVLDKMGDSPYEFLQNTDHNLLLQLFSGFVHRFAKCQHLCGLLMSAKILIAEYGSLYNCFLNDYEPAHKNILPALNMFCKKIKTCAPDDPGHLVPLPEKGSACKRINLFLRWMVRKDFVDPGGWAKISPSALIVPIDVHMLNIGKRLGLTTRKQGNMKTAIEITRGFARMVPEDPVRYDFTLTRLGIRDDINMEDFLTPLL